jgi:tRNA(Ile)-lysidine synthase TilS/MesJ
MQRKFAENMNELRGLINEWSALPCNVSDEGCSGEAGILLAVSGGIDSMCMAELFAALEPSVPFAVAHCNFNLRGEESDGDEALAREWAEGHNVRFHSKSFDTKAYASAQGISIEMAARDLRYGWFAELCREFGYKAVELLQNDHDSCAIGIRDNKVITMPFTEIEKQEKKFDKELYEIAHVLNL